MAKFEIHVIENGGKTYSKFGKLKRNEQIFFYNDHPGKVLEVQIHDGEAICETDGTTQITAPFDVAAGDFRHLKICKYYGRPEFKYTATLDQLPPEDPIIIVEHQALTPVINPIIIVGALAAIGGLVVGYLAGRRARRSPERAAT